jgi:glutamyl/glutaminyl-tRNA synthetase
VFTRDEMIAAFRIADVGKAGAKFDPEKLHWMCGEYIRRWSKDELLARARPWLLPAVPEACWQGGAAWLQNAVACYQERIAVLAELPGKIGWLFGEQVEPDAAALQNLHKHAEAGTWLRAYADLLSGLDLPPSFPADRGDADVVVRLPSQKDAPEPVCACATPRAIETATRAFAEQRGIKFGHFVHPVRAALTGTDKGPGLFDVVFLLGREKAVARLLAAAG